MTIKTVLLVEDELLIQKSLKRLLERHNVDVTAVSTGKDAIACLNQQNFDRIICDLMLQDLTGFDVIEESKQKYSISEISKLFIIITAYSSKQVLDKANEYGCKIISKPFADLNAAIKVFIQDEHNP